MSINSIAYYTAFIDKQNISEKCKQFCVDIIYTAYSDINTVILYGWGNFPPIIDIINKLCEYDSCDKHLCILYNNYMESIISGNLFLFCKSKKDIPLKWDIEYATKGTPFHNNIEFLNDFVCNFYEDLDSSLWLSSTPTEMVDILLKRFGETIMRGRQISWK